MKTPDLQGLQSNIERGPGSVVVGRAAVVRHCTENLGEDKRWNHGRQGILVLGEKQRTSVASRAEEEREQKGSTATWGAGEWGGRESNRDRRGVTGRAERE